MSTSPTWRQAFNTWEKAVAPGLEQMTASSGFQDVLAMTARVNATMAAEAERATRQWLHFWNVPAATDVRRLRQQVSSLERELRAVRRSLEAGETAPAPLGLVSTDADDDPDDLAAAS